MFILSAFIIFIAYLFNSLMGFGGGLIAIPLLALILPIKQAVVIVLLFGALQGMLFLANTKDIDKKILKSMLPAAIIATVLGLICFEYFTSEFMRISLAILIVIYLLYKIFISRPLPIPAWLAGVGGGLLQGLMGTGGPVFMMYFNESGRSKVVFRSTIMVVFCVVNFIRLGFTGFMGHLESAVFVNAASAVLPFFFALYIGQKYHGHVNKELFNTLVYIVLAISAVSLIIF